MNRNLGSCQQNPVNRIFSYLTLQLLFLHLTKQQGEGAEGINNRFNHGTIFNERGSQRRIVNKKIQFS